MVLGVYAQRCRRFLAVVVPKAERPAMETELYSERKVDEDAEIRSKMADF